MFSLRSLFVLMACIAAVLALFIPAVKAAREAARRMSCQNNLKQLGLAVHNYHGAFKLFPPAFQPSNQLSWTVAIQPYLEASDLYSRINQNAGPFSALGKNDPFGLTLLSYHLCPATDVIQMQTQLPHDASPEDLVPRLVGKTPFTIHYYGISGPLGSIPGRASDYSLASPLMHEGVPVAGSGVFQWNQRVSFASVSDGTSYTLCFGEMSWNSHKFGTRYRSWLNGGTDGSFVVGCRNIVRPINSHRKHSVLQPLNNMSMGSQHYGGAQFCLADGSARFLADETDLDLYRALASRDGQERLTTDANDRIEFDTSAP